MVVPQVFGLFTSYGELLDFIEDAVRVGDMRLRRTPGRPDQIGRTADGFAETGRGHQVVVVDLTSARTEQRDVPADLYLRGLLGDLYDDTMPMACDDLGPARLSQGLIDARAEWVGTPTDDHHDEWHWRSVLSYLTGEPGTPDMRGAEHVEFFVTDQGDPFVLDLRLFAVVDQLRVMRLYRAVAITALHLNELSASDSAALDYVNAWWAKAGPEMPLPKTFDQAILTAVRILNLSIVGLAPPRLELADLRSGSTLTEPLGSDLLTVLAGQILAHVSEGAPVRTCANETCGRLFRHQIGRAKFGQVHTKGVKYCTDSCARAAAQRAYRRRLKKQTA